MYKLTGYDYNTSYYAALLTFGEGSIREEWLCDQKVITVRLSSCKKTFDIFGKPSERLVDFEPKYHIYIYIYIYMD